MSPEINTLVVGGGQAGLAISEHLTSHDVSHVVIERDRIAERWRSGRWDSLVANGPAWHDRFPGMEFDADPDSFVGKERVADYFVEYAERISAPVRCGVEVHDVARLLGRKGFRATLSDGVLEVTNIVAATGPFQRPVIPPLVPLDSGIFQIHSNEYRNPDQLPEGGVIVVGAGSSGAQIADELLQSGRNVYLSVGAHNRPPRSYRGLDFVWWLGVLGKWDAPAVQPGMEHVTISVSGANGGDTVDFRRFADRGMNLVGMTKAFDDGTLTFESDLAANIAAGDRDHLSVLDEADEYAERNGLDLPEDPDARLIGPDPACMQNPLLELNLEQAGVTSILWATGYVQDYSWLDVDVVDAAGKPKHFRGVSDEPGVYFLGLPWQTRRASSFIFGVWQDAKYVADHIAAQRDYLAYANASQQNRG